MGNNQTRIEHDIAHRVTSEIVTRTFVSNKNITQALSLNSQTATIYVENSDVVCTSGGIGIEQNLAASMNVLSQVDSQSIEELKSQFESMLDVNAEQANEIITEALGGIGQFTDTEMKAKLRVNLKNSILTELTVENVNTSIANVRISQDGAITLIDSTYTGPCTISQNAIVQMQLGGFINQVAQKLIESSTISQADLSISSKNKVEHKGLDLLSMFFIIIAGLAIFALTLGLGIGKGAGKILIFLLIFAVCVGAAILVIYLVTDRLPWESSCKESCKADCGGEDCTLCVDCPEYCDPSNCRNCAETADDCYTCFDCQTRCYQKASTAAEKQACADKYPDAAPPSAMRRAVREQYASCGC